MKHSALFFHERIHIGIFHEIRGRCANGNEDLTMKSGPIEESD